RFSAPRSIGRATIRQRAPPISTPSRYRDMMRPLRPACAIIGRRRRKSTSSGGVRRIRRVRAVLKRGSMNATNRPLALVTGASAGIGAELARELARHGHDLVLTARSSAPMEALAAQLQELGAAAAVIPVDLSKPGAAATLAHEIAIRGLVVDVLVHHAGLV